MYIRQKPLKSSFKGFFSFLPKSNRLLIPPVYDGVSCPKCTTRKN